MQTSLARSSSSVSFALGAESMTAAYSRFLRIVTGILGFAGVAAIGLYIYELLFSFSLWRLLLCLVSIPGAAIFLWYAFHRECVWASGFGGAGGAASAAVPWPAPSKPPALSGSAAVALPRSVELTECRGISMPNKGASPNGGPTTSLGNSGVTEGPPSVS
jgi:hypothetical protein